MRRKLVGALVPPRMRDEFHGMAANERISPQVFKYHEEDSKIYGFTMEIKMLNIIPITCDKVTRKYTRPRLRQTRDSAIFPAHVCIIKFLIRGNFRG